MTADRGYGEAGVDDTLHDLGVQNVIIPRKGRPSKARQAEERHRAFRRHVKWRTGCEGRIRLGRWLKSKGVKKIWYLIVPAEVNGKPVKGADDFFAAGGTLEELKAARTTKPPNPDVTDDTFSDARLAETIADDVLAEAKGTEHSEECATLRGKRLLIAEELTEGRAIDVTALKQIMDVGMITARHVYQRNMTFPASHSLFTTTNYIPIVNETDHGTWRRLALLQFPYTFSQPGEPIQGERERPGDPTLKTRIKINNDCQHDAIVTWAVEGAMKWYANPETSLQPTDKINSDTRKWRAEADRIIAFCDEKLIADRNFGIVSTDMLEAFNAWLRRNGHNEWSRETFGPRFSQHVETLRHGVAQARPRQLPQLDRYGWERSLPQRPVIYLGVRFRNAYD